MQVRTVLGTLEAQTLSRHRVDSQLELPVLHQQLFQLLAHQAQTVHAELRIEFSW